MTVTQAATLGVVEGLTEYLPVSSTGHLVVTQRAMGIPNSDAANAFAICIQAGAILAVLGLYFRHVKQMTLGLIGRDDEGRKLLINLIVAFVPAAVMGLTVHKYIEAYLMGGEWGLWPIIGSWFVGGAAILVVHWMKLEKPPEEGRAMMTLTTKQALLIGVIQCLAMWPGVSRSLVTIVGGVLVGLSVPAAVEFSFLLGVVTLGAATAYAGLKHGDAMLAAYSPAALAAGFALSFVSAVLAVKWMVAYLNKHSLALFGYYRVVIAVVIAVLVLMQWI
ncbi:MAG: undecaprenyl-diphosphate phosphatase [Phycisphaera sp.]|nr:undecaprenyl-diphosphate phosphatase [Phycisphaera sp.]